MGCKGEVVKKLSDEEVRKLGEELAALPKGCISQKRIRGKVTFYRVPAQARHLLDRSKLALVRKSFGRVLSRTVLYRGENADLSNGICYRNVNDYLKGL